jgi:hypothetical protein
MNQGKYVFSQLISLINPNEFERCVERYHGNYKVKTFTCWHQLLCMIFGQLCGRESLRDIVSCLVAHEHKLYHLGLTKGVSRSTLADANEKRDWRIFSDFAQSLIQEARGMKDGEELEGLSFDNPIYAFDSSTVDLCLSVFWWAPFRKTKAAIKLHTLYDIRYGMPRFVHISDGLVSDVTALDLLEFERDSFYVMDRAYLSYAQLYRVDQSGAFFVVRTKVNTKVKRVYSAKVNKATGVRYDQTVKFENVKALKDYPDKLRLVKYYDEEKNRTLVFLTNNFEIKAEEVAKLYKYRWQVELFFKWIKQHLKVKVFYGESENAVKAQIWCAVCAYVLVAILRHKLKILQSTNNMLQILSVSLFDKTPVNQLFKNNPLHNDENDNSNQLKMFDL